MKKIHLPGEDGNFPDVWVMGIRCRAVEIFKQDFGAMSLRATDYYASRIRDLCNRRYAEITEGLTQRELRAPDFDLSQHEGFQEFLRDTEGLSGKEIALRHGIQLLEDFIEVECFPPYREMIIARSMNEAGALVSALEDSHLDDNFHNDMTYAVTHKLDYDEQVEAYKNGEDEERIVSKQLTRTDILTRLHRIASDDFGDDPDAWRRWYDTWRADPPPLGYR